MVISFVGDSILLWLSLFLYPFSSFILLWRMIPVYLNGFLSSIYSKPSNSSSVFAGVVAWWAGADWIRGYIEGELFPQQINWVIAILFCLYGIFALLVGILKKEKFYSFFGKRNILTFLLLSFYPIQTGYVKLNNEVLFAILIAFIPFLIFIGIISALIKKIMKVENSSTPVKNFPIPRRRFKKFKLKKFD